MTRPAGPANPLPPIPWSIRQWLDENRLGVRRLPPRKTRTVDPAQVCREYAEMRAAGIIRAEALRVLCARYERHRTRIWAIIRAGACE